MLGYSPAGAQRTREDVKWVCMSTSSEIWNADIKKMERTEIEYMAIIHLREMKQLDSVTCKIQEHLRAG